MKNHSRAEFAQFRFVRDSEGNVVQLPAQAMDEQILLVIDCERWGLSRLHIFEGAARRIEVLEAFETEMQKLASVHHDSVSQVVSWGRDSEELFYADRGSDGEALPDYLGRNGSVPVSVSGLWMVQLIDALESVPSSILSFERFSTQSLLIVIDRFFNVRPIFSEFHGWMKPGRQVQEHSREWYLAQVFCSLVGGVPMRTFHTGSLPRNFDALDREVRDAVLSALSDGQAGAYGQFKDVMVDLARGANDEVSEIALPRMPLREWVIRESAELRQFHEVAELPVIPDLERPLFAASQSIRGVPSFLQFIPGPDSLPREGWLSQHHEVTRRAGRVKKSQLQVNHIEDFGSLTLIGEEIVPGIDLASLILEVDPLPLASVAQLMDRVAAALTMFESQVGTCAVWWLPPENVLLLTKTQTRAAAVRLIERKGESAWQELPMKLRLHQTMTTLQHGVVLPPRVRDLSRVSGKKFEVVRRSAIALPMIYYVLTGKSFDWNEEVGKISLEELDSCEWLEALLERFRTALLEDPVDMEVDLFTEFQRMVASLQEGETAESGPESNEDDLNEVLDGVLFKGTVDL